MLKIPRMMAAMLAALTAALLLAGAALAQPTSPEHNFYGYAGDVTLDGNNVTSGTTISAWADGEVVASTTVMQDNSWNMKVPSDAGTVTFSVGDAVSDVSFPVRVAGADRVKLALMTPEPEPEPEPEVTEPEEPAGTEDGAEGAELEGELEGDMELEEDTGDMELEEDTGDMELEDEGTEDADEGTEDADEGTEDADEGTEDADEGTEDADEGMMQPEMPEGTEDGAMEEDEGAMDTVGDVNDFGTTGTGGLADGGSSAALWGGIGSALALLALLGGGFAIRRRSAQRS